MGFPRDYLDFTTWYLTRKGYITKADNSDFALTADGVDFVEAQRASVPVLNKLLTNGTDACAADLESEFLTSETAAAPVVVSLPDGAEVKNRRVNAKERRSAAPDWRANRFERRKNKDRRAGN